MKLTLHHSEHARQYRSTVRVLVFLLSGLFCCLGVSGVIFFAVWAGACFFFGCLGGGPGPAQTAKKTRSEGAGACFCFFAVWAGGVFFFLLFGRGRVLFLLFGRGRVLFFAVWDGGVFFFAVWAGDGSSLTYPSAWLVFKRPNNKRDRTAKTTRVPRSTMWGPWARCYIDFFHGPRFKKIIRSLYVFLYDPYVSRTESLYHLSRTPINLTQPL